MPDPAQRCRSVLAFHEQLSERTRYLRFFGPYPRIPPRDLQRFTTVDHRARVAFVCLLGDDIIAVGRYEGLPGDRSPGGTGTDATPSSESAEVAFVVRDDHQGRGLGSILLEHLAAAARENGLLTHPASSPIRHGEFPISTRRVRRSSTVSSSFRHGDWTEQQVTSSARAPGLDQVLTWGSELVQID